MKSELPKVLHTVSGLPMLGHVLNLAEAFKPERIIVVAGYKKELVERFVGARAVVVEQAQRLGSGHAVLQAKPELDDLDGAVLVLCGDMPLLSKDTIEGLIAEFEKSGADGCVLSGVVGDPAGYGRIVRASSGEVTGIVEDADATPEEKAIREINTGAYIFNKEALFAALADLKPNRAKGEYYLTDTVARIASKKRFAGKAVADASEAQGINSRRDLARAETAMNERILDRWMSEGVTVRDPRTTWIGAEVTIGPDTEILPNTVIDGPAKIGRRCQIGPFARIRAGVTIGDDACIGNFVEIVRSRIGDRSLVKHLSYLGDAEIASDVNVGAGTITANFDGRSKHKTVIEEGARIGSGTVFVAPVRVGRGAKTGAGAVITRGHDVPAGETAVGIPARVLTKGKKS